MAQTTFANDPAAYFEGQRASMRASDRTRGGKLVAAETIKLAKAVQLDVSNGDQAVKTPSSGSDQIVGVSFNDGHKALATDGTLTYVQNDVIPLVVQGDVAVTAEQDVTPADAVYVRHTSGGGALLPGNFRKDAAQTVGTARKQTLTISGALDEGAARVQKLVLDADLVALDQVDGTIAGQAISAVTYATSHAVTMQQIVAAIMGALEAAGKANGVAVYVPKATPREIHIASARPTSDNPNSATDLPLTGWAVTFGGAGTAVFASATGADVTQGKAPHSLSVQLDGAGAIAQSWQGSSDETLEQFAALIAQQSGVASAVVTKVTDSAAPGNSDRVITITSSTNGPATTAITNPTVSGGATARTMAAAETVAGVADSAAKAMLLAGARWLSSATAGDPVVLSLNLP